MKLSLLVASFLLSSAATSVFAGEQRVSGRLGQLNLLIDGSGTSFGVNNVQIDMATMNRYEIGQGNGYLQLKDSRIDRTIYDANGDHIPVTMCHKVGYVMGEDLVLDVGRRSVIVSGDTLNPAPANWVSSATPWISGHVQVQVYYQQMGYHQCPSPIDGQIPNGELSHIVFVAGEGQIRTSR